MKRWLGSSTVRLGLLYTGIFALSSALLLAAVHWASSGGAAGYRVAA